MGQFRSIIFGVLVVARVAAAQPGPQPSADLARQGTELYNAGNFADAASTFQRAVELEPNNVEYKFKLAQALDKGGRCEQALPIYKALGANPPADHKADIDAGIAHCSPQPAAPVAAAESESSAPGGSTKIDTTSATMLMGGGVALGAGIILLWSGYTHSGDADAAATVSDHNRISGRATGEYVIGSIGIAAGLALGVYAMHRIRSSKDETAVAIVPGHGGGTLVLERSW